MKFSEPEIALRDMRERALRRKHVKPDVVDYFAESRAKFVRKYKANSSPWPDGIGAWYKPDDWADGDDEHGDRLIAVGEARVQALDPWANVRAKGEPCPPLPVVDAVSSKTVDAASTAKNKASTLGEAVDAVSKARNAKSERQARWRAAQKAKPRNDG